MSANWTLNRLIPIKSIQSLMIRSPKEDPLLDGLRGISVMMIVFFHSIYAVFYILKDGDRLQQFISAIPSWAHILLTTEKAVDIFFVVSGYLLGMSLVREFRKFDRLNAPKFYVRRWFRIYPVFLLALFIYGLGNIDRSLDYLWVNLFFLDNFHGQMIIPVGWSLSVEMQFYLILPVLVLGLMKTGRPLTCLLLLFLAMTALLWLICTLNPEIASTPFYDFRPGGKDPEVFLQNLYYPTQGRLGPLILGLFWGWYHVVCPDLSFQKFLDRLSPVIREMALLLCCIVIYVTMRFPVYDANSWFYQPFSMQLNLWGHVMHRHLFCMALVTMMILLNTQGLRGPFHNSLIAMLQHGFWRPFSQLVFPIYLFHFPAIALASVIVLGTTNMQQIEMMYLWQVCLIFLMAMFVVFFFALLVHFKLEVPMIQKGNQLANSWFPDHKSEKKLGVLDKPLS
ncbi:MAG: hypothetical protein CMP10_12520 [Zetaproteobacteria bacterium]|nr:hypothetical protein [Pseudobdellovibrionaceae bacterium]